MEENKTSAKLIHELQQRTFRLKVAQTVLLVIVAASLIVLLIFAQQLQASNHVLRNGQQDTITALDNKIDSLQHHVDCLFNLATQPSHSSSYIANAKTCEIAHSASAKGDVFAPAVPLPLLKPAASASSTKPAASPAPADSAKAQPAPPAKKVFGVSVCLPFTKVCVLQ